MKEVNILSIVQAYKNLDPSLSKKYYANCNFKIKDSELVDLNSMIDEIQEITEIHSIFNSYFIGYNIPQINKEFDLLRFGDNYLVNLELKRTSTEREILEQLQKNYYYLKFTGDTIYNFTYVSDSRKIYKLVDDGLKETDLYEVIAVLEEQDVKHISDINNLFEPTNYLVSPFNSTKTFLKGEYFLTQQQKNFKVDIVPQLIEKKFKFIAISGEAGTGKSLLIYDIIKDSINNDLNVLVIHVGKLNDGHHKLNRKGYNIIPIKSLKNTNLNNYDLIVIDETQRITKIQLECVINFCESNNRKCIFGYDSKQCLKKEEIDREIEKNIISLKAVKIYNLTKTIRTNQEISTFITGLFNKKTIISTVSRSNINLHYFDNHQDAKSNIESLSSDWKVINLTTSLYDVLPYDKYTLDGEENAHDVIGQEFDNVAVIIDSYFYYDGNRLNTKGYRKNPTYHPTNMLYQILSRTRKKLHIVILDNNVIMERCLEICS